MNIFEFSQLLATQAQSSKPYLEFLRVSALSVGVYVLEAGASDHQKPHSEDEVYYVVSGRARMSVDEPGGIKSFAVGPGKLLYVQAGVRHSFHQITEKLVVLVFFAPPEGTLGATKS